MACTRNGNCNNLKSARSAFDGSCAELHSQSHQGRVLIASAATSPFGGKAMLNLKLKRHVCFLARQSSQLISPNRFRCFWKKGCSSSVEPPSRKPNNFLYKPRQVVSLPPHDDKFLNLDFSGRGEDIAYPWAFIECGFPQVPTSCVDEVLRRHSIKVCG